MAGADAHDGPLEIATNGRATVALVATRLHALEGATARPHRKRLLRFTRAGGWNELAPCR